MNRKAISGGLILISGVIAGSLAGVLVSSLIIGCAWISPSEVRYERRGPNGMEEIIMGKGPSGGGIGSGAPKGSEMTPPEIPLPIAKGSPVAKGGGSKGFSFEAEIIRGGGVLLTLAGILVGVGILGSLLGFAKYGVPLIITGLGIGLTSWFFQVIPVWLGIGIMGILVLGLVWWFLRSARIAKDLHQETSEALETVVRGVEAAEPTPGLVKKSIETMAKDEGIYDRVKVFIRDLKTDLGIG